MLIYLKLLATAMVPVVVSVVAYLVKRMTPFGNQPELRREIFIGIVFGLVAIFGTEFGVDVGGATANARDAAPLCAGLLFGGPAGITAGLIGGIHRWIVAERIGMYSRIACSISTIFAGFFAAFLRKYMFDDRRPTPGFAFATGLVMEIIHMTILFLTHLSDAEKALDIVRICTLPMVFANAVSVMLAVIAVSTLSLGIHKKKLRYRKISQQVQTWLLVCIVAAYLVTTLFVYRLQTGFAENDAKKMLELNVKDIKEQIIDTSNANLLAVNRAVAAELAANPNAPLDALAEKYDITDVVIVNSQGIITKSNIVPYVGFDMKSGDQSREFMILTQGAKEYVQEYQPRSFDSGEGETGRKFSGVATPDGGFIQVAYDSERFQSDVSAQVRDAAKHRSVGENGFAVIADENFIIVSDRSDHSGSIGKNLNETGIWIDDTKKQDTVLEGKVYGADSYYMYTVSEGFFLVASIPKSEAFAERDMALYVNSYMEVLVFAVLFILIYFLLKSLVVNNIRVLNDDLSKIIGGNLDVTVDVRSSAEFASLSDDINSTVETLKNYIDEAASRIDKELAFAKNIQHAALPSVFPAYPNVSEFDIYATMNTAKEVGGDFYDFYMLGEDKIAFLIADVSGKGIPAAMFMMTAKTTIKNLAETGIPVNEVFTRSNEKLCEGNDAGMFVTAWMGILDIRTGHVTFANAGHNPPLIYRNGIGFEYLRSRAGLVLGGMEGLKYKLQEIDLNPGDKIYLYTDGVTEATDSNTQLYGEDRLIHFIDEHAEDSAEQTLIAVKGDIDRFVGDAEQFDDITMLMLDYKGGETKEVMIEKVFPADKEALSDVIGFVEETLEEADCSPKAMMQISVAVEELFVNVASYAYPEGGGDVEIGVSVNDDKAVIRFSDSGLRFDPLAKTDPDITLAAEDRSIGGLGIFMVKKTMDDVFYEYKDGHNILTIVKKI